MKSVFLKVYRAILVFCLFLPLVCCSSKSSKRSSPKLSSQRMGHHLPKKHVKIIIDPGHGGEDYGTYSLTKPRKHEKFFAMRTALLLEKRLKKMGFRTFLTRRSDKTVSLKERSNFANRRGGTLFVSLHYNSAPNRSAKGIEVFYYNSRATPKRSRDSKFLADRILFRIIANTKARSRGVKHGNFSVIRETRMPAVLVEGGFLTNNHELHLLKNPKYLEKIALGVARGVEDYFK